MRSLPPWSPSGAAASPARAGVAGGAATGLADLRAKGQSSYWHDAANGRLYLKVYAAEGDNDYKELKVEPAP